jgi:hypothetical protein
LKIELDPPSSPVSGANFYGPFEMTSTASLSLALTNAAKALLAAIEALGVTAPGALPGTNARSGATVLQCANDFLRAKARAGRSDRYLRQLRVSLSSFVKGRYNQPVDSLTVTELEAWLDKKKWEPGTKKSYLTDVSTMLSWAQRRGLVSRNPALAVEWPWSKHPNGIALTRWRRNALHRPLPAKRPERRERQTVFLLLQVFMLSAGPP